MTTSSRLTRLPPTTLLQMKFARPTRRSYQPDGATNHDQPDGAAQQWLARINKRREEFFKLFRRFAEVEPRTETPWTTWGLGLDISSYWLRANVVYFVIYVSRSFILNVVGRNVMIGCVSPQALGFDWLRVVYLHTLLTNRWCCVQCNSYYLSRVLCILS